MDITETQTDPETGAQIEVPTGRTEWDKSKTNLSDNFGVGIKIAAGACIKLKDNSSLFVSIPIVGAGYNYTHQFHSKTQNSAHISRFNVSREIDFLAIQVGYTHFIKSKKKK